MMLSLGANPPQRKSTTQQLWLTGQHPIQIERRAVKAATDLHLPAELSDICANFVHLLKQRPRSQSF